MTALLDLLPQCTPGEKLDLLRALAKDLLAEGAGQGPLTISGEDGDPIAFVVTPGMFGMERVDLAAGLPPLADPDALMPFDEMMDQLKEPEPPAS